MRAFLHVALASLLLTSACSDSPAEPPREPDTIAFVAGGAVQTMRIDGTERRTITPRMDAWDPEWSPDGSEIAFWAGKNFAKRLYIVAADGTNLRQVVDAGVPDESPTWSPDGRQIAFTRGRQIYVVNRDGTGTRRLTDRSLGNDEAPAWSWVSNRILFTRYAYDGRQLLVSIGPDGSDPAIVGMDGNDPAWSPEGRRIAFARFHLGEGYSIYVADAAGGGEATRLTGHEVSAYTPAWSPDGKSLAYMAMPDVDISWLDIYVMDLATRQVKQVTSDVGMEAYPSWRPR